MADFPVKPTVVLLDNTGAVVPDSVVQWVEAEVNKGWTASVILNKAQDFDFEQDRFATMRIRMVDDLGGIRTTPPMVFPISTENDSRNVEGASIGTLSLEDESSCRMRTPNQNFPSFLAVSSATLMETLGTSVGVTIADAPDQHVTEEEVKGEKPDEALDRFRKAYAYETVVEEDGQIRFFPWEAGGTTLDIDWANRNRTRNKNLEYTDVRLGKTSSMVAGENEWYFDWDLPGFFERDLPVPLNEPFADGEHYNLVGSFGAATFLDDAGGIVEHFYWDDDYKIPPVGMGGSAGPATTVHVVVLPGVGFAAEMTVGVSLKVTGTPVTEEDPPPAGVDLQFLTPAAGVSLGGWPYHENIIEPLYPSLAYAQERKPHILDRLNSASDTLTMDAQILRCHSGVWLRNRHTRKEINYKVMKIRWDGTGKRTALSLVRVTSG